MKFIVVVILSGVIGFVVSVFVLVNPISESPFFENTIIQKKDKVDSLLSNRIVFVNKMVDSLDKEMVKSISSTGNAPNNPRFKRLDEALKKAEDLLQKTIVERNELRASNIDKDSVYYTKYLSVDRHLFYKSLNSENFNINSIEFNIVDPELISYDSNYNNIIKFTVGLENVPSESKVAFINKYPAFGFWLIASIAQMCLWFMVGTIIVLMNYETLKKLKAGSKKYILKTAGYVILVTFVMTAFLFITYYLLIDAYVIEDHIFLKNFTLKMYILAIFGYTVASICFFIYLLLADQAHQLNDLLPPGYLTKLEILQSTFNYSFAFSALILSVFIIWLGAMFNAINSIELMNYYRQISGQDYLNSNYVYLVGLLHSLLLLIFYIPVQLKFNTLDIVRYQKGLSVVGLPSSKKFFTGIIDNISSILITASPLLTSFLQNMLTTFISE
ncbi:hypothetical protein [Rufibacter psychrotolerans]|uniref:hypothetical protein n=1 Tax=Rufibacter psychrotolerans TaxID=2812556 RepID=UPI001968046A|nr:hypothetical protein [Rufibacter sp. SYSU D00308]